MKKIAVFCSSMSGPSNEYTKLASKTVDILVQEKFGIIYGGGSTGLMGVVANRALELNAHVTGIIPEFLDNREKINKQLNYLHVTKTMEQRKKLFLKLSDIFIALPGGGGTIEEISLVISANQLKVIKCKPVIIFNYKNFWKPLLDQYKKINNKYFTRENLSNFILECKNYKELRNILDRL